MASATIAEAGGIALVALLVLGLAPLMAWAERRLVAHLEQVNPATLVRTREGILAAAKEARR